MRSAGCRELTRAHQIRERQANNLPTMMLVHSNQGSTKPIPALQSPLRYWNPVRVDCQIETGHESGVLQQRAPAKQTKTLRQPRIVVLLSLYGQGVCRSRYSDRIR